MNIHRPPISTLDSFDLYVASIPGFQPQCVFNVWWSTLNGIAVIRSNLLFTIGIDVYTI
jgi:hypothetical protein